MAFLSGCVGIGFVHSKVDEYDGFLLGPKPEVRGGGNVGITQADVKSQWGTPDKIEDGATAKQRWIYYDGLSWAGVIPMIGIGIPLLVPSGRDYVEMVFDGDKAFRARRSRTGWSGFICGFLDEGGVQKGCATLK
jgi:hypothetical protein